jgi:predicted Zn-dependent protease with MMP-like domain
VTFDWKFLLTVAQEEVAGVIASLPAELEDVVKSLPVTYDPQNDGDLRPLDSDDTLGLFVGKSLLTTDEQVDDMPAHVILFLANIWEFAEADEDTYRKEVRRTFVHELGHFLGLEEIDLEERGL